MSKSEKTKCKKCAYEYMDLKEESELYKYRGKYVEITGVPFLICPSCQFKYIPNTLKDIRISKIKKAVRKLTGYEKFLKPKDLKQIRSNLGYTLEEMDSLVGAKFGSYKTWENGAKITSSHNLILKLIKKELEGDGTISIVDSLREEKDWWKNV